MERLEHFFRLKDHKTTVSTEIAAGFTTFITMSYIILVNPELIASGVAAAGGPSDDSHGSLREASFGAGSRNGH